MSIAITRPIVGIASTSNASSYAMSAFTPSANSLLVALVCASGTVITTPTMTGGSLTWTRQAVAVNTGSSGDSCYIFTAQVGSSPASTTPTFDCTGDNATGCLITLLQFTGHDTINPVVQTKMPTAQTTSTNANLTFASALKTLNGYAIAWNGALAANSSTPPTGWTEANDIAYSTPSNNQGSAYRAGGETTTGPYTFTNGSTTWMAMGIEIKAANITTNQTITGIARIQQPPTVVLDTANANVFGSTTPALLFTGTDGNSDDIRYKVQISNNSGFLGPNSFVAQGISNQWWVGVAVDSSNGDVFVVENQTGKIYKQTGGSGAFNLVTTLAGAQDVAVNSSTHDVWTCVNGGDIYKQSGGSGAFAAQSAGNKAWGPIAVDPGSGDVFCGAFNIDIYRNAGGTSSFSTTGAGAVGWSGIFIDTANHDVYGVNGSNSTVYKQTAASGSFTLYATGTGLNWNNGAINPSTKDIYIAGFFSDIYKQTAGTGSFVAQSAGVKRWSKAAINESSGAVYAVNQGISEVGDIWKIDPSNLLLTKISGTDTGFTDITNGADTDPFASTNQIQFQVQAGDALTPSITYYWRVAGIDPSGTNTYGAYPSSKTFTVTVAATNQTIQGKSRIQQIINQTIQGKSRILQTVLQTITGQSRIRQSVLQTIQGQSRITAKTNQTIQGKANIRNTTNQIITGKSRIQESVNQTITGKTRIQQIVLQTITGKARIQQIVNTTITGKARVQQIVNQTITGKARIQEYVSQTIQGRSRIQEIVNQTIQGKSRITATTNQTIQGKARITAAAVQTITGKSRIQKTTLQTITGKASIIAVTNQTITGKATILHPSGVLVTRFYLSNSKIASIGTVEDASWGVTTGSDQYEMTTYKDGSTMGSKTTGAGIGTGVRALNRKYVSPPLAAQTLIGSPNAYIQLGGYIRSALNTLTGVTSSTLIMDIGILKANGTYVYGGSYDGGAVLDTSLKGQSVAADNFVLGNLVIDQGDRIVVAFGLQINSGSATNILLTQSFGEDSATDLAINSTSPNNPWLDVQVPSPGIYVLGSEGTITGKSRIQQIVNQTIQGKSRITAITNQTITGKASIIPPIQNKTITGIARIQKIVNQTIQGKTRITATTNQTITGKSRIQESVNQTITGKSRIQESVNQTIQGKARITVTTQQTIQGKARITATTLKTIQGKARIQESVSQTITGKSRIQESVSQTIQGKARIQESVNQIITGKARITATTNQTITGKSRITATTLKTITGKARIQESVLQTIAGKSRIQEIVNSAIQGRSRITATTNQIITGKAKITATTQQTISGKAKITATTNQTITGKARITVTTNKVITGKARIQESILQTITGKARIQLTSNQTITGIARIGEMVNQTIQGKANIRNTTNQTITGRARIQHVSDATITGKARIVSSVSQDIQGQARIQETVNSTITGKSRIQLVTNQTIQGQSRITAKTNRTITGIARIFGATSQIITGKARIQQIVNTTITGKSRIQEYSTKTITGKSRITIIVDQTITGKAFIVKRKPSSYGFIVGI